MECAGASSLAKLAERGPELAAQVPIELNCCAHSKMVASLLTPLTTGIQDYRLFSAKTTGKFVRQWRKTTRFATQMHRVDCITYPDYGRTVQVDIPTKGHLVGRIYFVTEVGPSNAYSVGHTLIESMQVSIGGTVTDRIDGRLLEVLDEFYTPLEKVDVVNRLIGRDVDMSKGGRVCIHLPFWFSGEDPHMWFPIDAVNVDRMRIELKLRTAAATGGTLFRPENAAAVLGESYFLVEYVYLDSPEANRLRVANIEIPIVQHVGVPVFATDAGASRARIPFRIGNPTKSLFFFAQRDDVGVNIYNTSTVAGARPALGVVGAATDEPVCGAALVYSGGQVRYQTNFMNTFRVLMPSIECVKAPVHTQYFYYMGFDVGNRETRRGIPRGEANLDFMREAELRLDLRPLTGVGYNIYIYAMTYNILTIYGGRAGLLFAY